MNHKRSLLAVLLLASVLIVWGLPKAWAADAEDIGSVDYLTEQMFGFEERLNTMINNVLGSSSVYVRHTRIVLVGFLVLSLIITLTKWVFGGKDPTELFSWVIRALLIILLYNSFSFLTSMIWDWMNEVGRQVQVAMVGDSSLYGPSTFVTKVSTLVNFQEGNSAGFFSLPDLSISAIFTAALLKLISILVFGAAFVTAIWPIKVYAFAKIIGLFFVPFLFFESTSKWFDGWFRFFAGFAIFAFFSKAALSVVAILYSSYFDIPYGAAVNQPQILIEGSGLDSILGVTVIGLGSVGLFMVAAFYSINIVGGDAFAALSAQRAINGASRAGGAMLARAAGSSAKGAASGGRALINKFRK